MKIVYICSPYNASTQPKITANCRRAAEVAKQLALAGLGFICPHNNSRDMHVLDIDPEFWYEMYLAILDGCDAVLALSGWQKSSGCQLEVARAKKLAIPVFMQTETKELLKWAGK